MVVGGFEGVGTDDPAAARLAQCVSQLVTAVGRVDIDEDGADFRTGKLGDAPLRAVGRPDTQAVPAFKPQGHQRVSLALDRIREGPPAVAQPLVPDHQRFELGKARHG
ncbi:hypothetical protein D9M71_776910 [compost metagenome]